MLLYVGELLLYSDDDGTDELKRLGLRKRMIRIRLIDRLRQEVYSKDKEMYNEMSGLLIFKEEDENGRERVT